MKKTDVAMIILIASLSVMVAFFAVNSIPQLKVDPKGVKVQTTEAIDPNVSKVDTKIFNSSAINPTVETVIGGAPAQ